MSDAGKWKMTMNTPIGAQQLTAEIRPDGSLTFPRYPQTGASKLEAVKVDGASVAFNVTVNSLMGRVNLAFTGTIAGNQISGTCKTRFGDMNFTGEKE
jgi:hypothetical protein